MASNFRKQSKFQQHYGARLEAGAIEPDAAQALAVAALANLSDALRSWRPKRSKLLTALFGGASVRPRGLYIHGKIGRGKTMLMDLFFETAPISRKRRIHFHAFMAEAHDMIGAARQSHAGDPLSMVARRIADRTALLCFDEMHITDIADAMILGRLFKGLFESGVVVVATSNMAPGDLYRNGLNRQLFLPFIGLMQAHMDVIELAADKDFRLHKLAGKRRYFSPLGAAADQEMDRLWLQLGGGLPAQAATLKVKGRALVVPKSLARMARFRFDELCARPLGPLDYLAIAQSYDTIFMDHLPILTPDRRNEARRFINLVDTLYDNQISLIVSAEAEADAIYKTGDGAALFERTVSRLIEMRCDDYLKRRARRQAMLSEGETPGIVARTSAVAGTEPDTDNATGR